MAINDILMGDETLFKSRKVFNPDYVPEKFLHRENQMDALALCLRPALHGGKPTNAVVVGSCATGKTTAIKKIFEKVEGYSDRILCVYVNCQLHTTPFNIFSQIYQRIFGHLPPETGKPLSIIYQKIMRNLQDTERALVVALDDVTYLFYKKRANKIFYDILRAHEEFEGVRTGIFAVLSDIEFRFLLDKNVNSVFIPQEIIFSPYSPHEIKNILKERIKIGFYPDVIPEEIVDEITENTVQAGDLRVGLDLLGLLGNIAEADSSKKITLKHLNSAIQNNSSSSLKDTINSLSSNETALLEVVVQSIPEDLVAGKLYQALNRNKSLSYASFDRILNKLEFLRIIDTKFTGKGSKGNSRQIILRYDSNEIEKILFEV